MGTNEVDICREGYFGVHSREVLRYKRMRSLSDGVTGKVVSVNCL